MKAKGNLLNLVDLMNAAPRCSATSKRSRQPCRAPAVKGWNVCRCHGARGGAPKGKTNGNWKHGECTNAALAERRFLTVLISQCRKAVTQLTEG